MARSDIRRKTEATPPTVDAFVGRLSSEGFDKSVEVYGRFTAQHPGFKLSDNELFSWGARLNALTDYVRSREIFRLGAQLYPDKTYLIEGLAEMQAKTSQKEEALATYRKVLALDPQHADAAHYVKANTP